MGLTSLQVCMDSSDHWLQVTAHEDSAGMDSSPSPLSPNDILTCSQPLSMERRLRPPHDQVMKCPRCESTHTKFCYYNNYSLSQPRYFCKTCRRYWTKGGTLRNIPVGGGCRKNKKTSSKKQNDNNSPIANASSSSNTTDLHMSFPEHVHLSSLMGPHHQLQGNNFMPIEFMESKLEGIVGNSHRINSSFDFLGTVNMANVANNGHNLLMEHNFHPNVCTPFGMTSLLDGNQGSENGTFGQYEAAGHEVKPSARALLSLDWPSEQVCSGDQHVGRDSFGYINGLGNWTGAINNYGPSNTNPLV